MQRLTRRYKIRRLPAITGTFLKISRITRTLTNIPDYNPLNGFHHPRLVQGRYVTEYPTAKTEEYLSEFLMLKTAHVAKLTI